MSISEEKMKIVINNYFKSECNVNTSIREAFEKGFRIGVKKGLAQSKADTPQTEEPKKTQTNEPTEYEKSIFAFGELLFNKDKQDEFIRGCEALGIKAD